MRVAQRVQQGCVKSPRKVTLAMQELQFRKREMEVKPLQPAQLTTQRQAAALSKARWLGRMTMPVKVVQINAGVEPSISKAGVGEVDSGH